MVSRVHCTDRIFDWQNHLLVHKFPNIVINDARHEGRPKVTSLSFVNDDDLALLMTGTGKPFLQC